VDKTLLHPDDVFFVFNQNVVNTVNFITYAGMALKLVASLFTALCSEILKLAIKINIDMFSSKRNAILCKKQATTLEGA